jgi:hypothetical protein
MTSKLARLYLWSSDTRQLRRGPIADDRSPSIPIKRESDLEPWFERGLGLTKHFVKGINPETLPAMHSTDALDAFVELLAKCPEADVIAVIRKLDPQRPDLMKVSRPATIEHIGKLASGPIQPTPKPGRRSRSSAKGARKAGDQQGAREGSRY